MWTHLLILSSDLFWQEKEIKFDDMLVLPCISLLNLLTYRSRLTTPEAIRRWIPDIKRDIDYFMKQVMFSVQYIFLDRRKPELHRSKNTRVQTAGR